MNKIKVVSNPYEKTVTFCRYDLSSESWITINSENNSNSKLVSAVFQRGFFPFKVYDILKEIENEYSVPDEKKRPKLPKACVKKRWRRNRALRLKQCFQHAATLICCTAPKNRAIL